METWSDQVSLDRKEEQQNSQLQNVETMDWILNLLLYRYV